MSSKMPIQIWILTLSAFAIGTAEFVIAGILTEVASDLHISVGRAGYLITAYALAIVFGGPILTLWLARFDKRKVLLGLMALFILGNFVAATTHRFPILLVSRVLVGLVQGPFYGIGAVVATHLVSEKLAGRAVGQMFAGLTLANVLGVPGGSWIGHSFGWNLTFFVVAGLGVLAAIAIAFTIPSQARTMTGGFSIEYQLKAFGDPQLQASLAITTLGWTGFMTFYGYTAAVAEQVAGFSPSDITWILVLIGAGLVVGNSFGGKSADAHLSSALKIWPAAMIASLVILGVVASYALPFVIAAVLFGVASFANVPPMQMRVMKYGVKAPELAATANISAFNIANALGSLVGGIVVDSRLGAAIVPFAAALASTIGLLFILWQERRTILSLQS